MIDDDYPQFLLAYNDGLACIDELRDKGGSESPKFEANLMRRCTEFTSRLRSTSFGERLYWEPVLSERLIRFEVVMPLLIERMRKAKVEVSEQEFLWVSSPTFRLERAFRYYGGMGKILHYHRDEMNYLRGTVLDDIRQRIQVDGRNVASAIETYLSHVISDVLLSKSERRSLLRLQEGLTKAAAFRLHPVGGLSGLLVARWEVVIQQYAEAVCHLCLELFGHIERHSLDEFLTVKSAIAIQHGLDGWRASDRHEGTDDEGNLSRQLNRYIEAAYPWALKQMVKGDWQTQAIVRHSADPKVRGKLNQLKLPPQQRDYLPEMVDRSP